MGGESGGGGTCHKTFSELQGGFQGIQGNKELIGGSLNSNRLRFLINFNCVVALFSLAVIHL